MSGAVKVFEEQITISQTKDDNMAALGKFGIEPIKQPDDVLLEILRLGASNTASTDIVSYQLHKKNHRVIGSLITMQSLDISPTVS